jgi:6-phosphogluconolactonase
MHKWFVYKEFNEASKAAADFIASRIEASIAQKNSCHVILPGGNTPAICLSYLAEKNLPWNKVHWYPGDERCYPSGHDDRNDVMLNKNLWSHLADTNVHMIPAELGAEEAASVYRELVSSIENFDIAFLGMGEDGHTASLFPDNAALQDTRSVVPVYDSPKTPDERVSFSINTLKNARCRIVLTSGASKAGIIARIKDGEPLPINCLGEINWYVDKAAASKL